MEEPTHLEFTNIFLEKTSSSTRNRIRKGTAGLNQSGWRRSPSRQHGAACGGKFNSDKSLPPPPTELPGGPGRKKTNPEGCPAAREGSGFSRIFLPYLGSRTGAGRERGEREPGSGARLRLIPLTRLQSHSAVGDGDPRDPGVQGRPPHPRCACSATRSTALPRLQPLAQVARAPRTHPRPVRNLRSRQPPSDKLRETSADARESTPTPWTRGSPLIGRRSRGGPSPSLLATPTSPALTLLLCRSRTLAWFPRPVEGEEGETARLGFASAESRPVSAWPRRLVLALGGSLRSSWPFFPKVDWGHSLKAFFSSLPVLFTSSALFRFGALLGGEGKMAGLSEGAVRTRGPKSALVRARAGARSCV